MKKNLQILILLLAFIPLNAGMQRHNDQGLSPTHSYKAVGPNEVISNQNGNMMISEVAADITRTPLGIKVERAYNSHWRDPLMTWQMDYDYDKANERKDGNKDIRYKNIDPPSSFFKMEPYGGDVFMDQYYSFDSPEGIPQSWAWAASSLYTMSMGVKNIAEAVENAAQGFPTPTPKGPVFGGQHSFGSQVGNCVAGAAVIAIQVMSIVENWDNLDFRKQNEAAVLTEIGVTTTTLGMANQFFGVGGQTLGNALAVVGVVMSIYNLQKFLETSNEWDPGHDAQEFAAYASVGLSIVGLVGAVAGKDSS